MTICTSSGARLDVSGGDGIQRTGICVLLSVLTLDSDRQPTLDFEGPWDKTQESLLAEEEELDFYHLFPALESDRYHLLRCSTKIYTNKELQTEQGTYKVQQQQQKEGKKRKKKNRY